MKILIDADGCPVVKETVTLADKYKLECLIFCNTAHEISHTTATTIVVDKGRDMADFALVNRVKPGDIVITQDYGLAAMVLAKKGLVISQNGMQYTDKNIDHLLLSRHVNREIRQRGGRLSSVGKRTGAQNKEFIAGIELLINEGSTKGEK